MRFSVSREGDPSWGRMLLNVVVFLVYVFMFAPILIVIILSFNSSNFASFPFQGVSIRWFKALWKNDAILEAFLTSVSLGILTALIGTSIALLAAMALVRHRIFGSKVIGNLMVTPLLIPETALAVGLLLLLRTLGLPRTYMILLVGHILITLPFAFLVIQNRLSTLGRFYEEAAGSLGARPLSIFLEITFPLSMPAIIAALLFVFTISFDNITATLFWRPSGVETLPTQIFAMLKDSVSPEINALGTAMIVITVGLTTLAGVIGSRITDADT